MKRMFWLLTGLLLTFAVCLGAAAEEPACEHVWIPYDKATHGVAEGEVTLSRADDFIHAYMFNPPEKVCVLCGERLNEVVIGSAGHDPHAYTVSQWALDEARGTVEITWCCGVCAYTHTAVLELQTILDGTADSCLYGGPCNMTQMRWADLHENGMLLFDARPTTLPWGLDPGEAVVYEALIYDPEEQTFQVGVRAHCAVCGRPMNRAYPIFRPTTHFNTRDNGMRIMTEEYFLTDGVPKNLPYQLIDQLREEAAACVHRWVPYNEALHGILPEEITVRQVDETYHACSRWYPSEVCELCGERTGGHGGGPWTPHSYTVTDWSWNEAGDAARITLSCGVCQYVYTYELPLAALLTGTDDSCLHGGACDLRQSAQLYENGMILPYGKMDIYRPDLQLGEPQWYISLVYVEERGQYMFTDRVHCPTCGRPRADWYQQLPADYDLEGSGIPMMDEDQFLTVGVPEDLPYQLIDQLREEAAATT